MDSVINLMQLGYFRPSNRHPATQPHFGGRQTIRVPPSHAMVSGPGCAA